MVLGQWGCADFPMGVRRLWFSFPVFIWITGYPLDGALVKVLQLILTHTHSYSLVKLSLIGFSYCISVQPSCKA